MTSEDILLWAIECWAQQENLEILEVQIKKPVPSKSKEQTHNETNTII